MTTDDEVRVSWVTPGGVATRTYSDGAATMRVCVGHLRNADDGLLKEYASGHEPVPWESAEVREEALSVLEVRSDLTDEERRGLLQHVAETPYYEAEGGR